MFLPHSKGQYNYVLDICPKQELESNALPYNTSQLVEPNFWNGAALLIFLFNTNKFIDIDINNISTSLLKIANFIQNRSIKDNSNKNITDIIGFDQAVWIFISSIYKAGWDKLKTFS